VLWLIEAYNERDVCVDVTTDDGDEQTADEEAAQQDNGDTRADEDDGDAEEAEVVLLQAGDDDDDDSDDDDDDDSGRGLSLHLSSDIPASTINKRDRNTESCESVFVIRHFILSHPV